MVYAGHDYRQRCCTVRFEVELTTRDSVHLVLDEEIHQRHKRAEESTSQVFPVPNGGRIRRAKHQAANRPGQGSHQVADHENVMPIMVIRARNVRPSTTSECPEHAHAGNEFGQCAARPIGQAVKEEDQHKSRARTYSDEDLEDGSLWIAITNRGADGGKPFLRVAPVLVLHDLVVVKGNPNDQRANECDVR